MRRSSERQGEGSFAGSRAKDAKSCPPCRQQPVERLNPHPAAGLTAQQASQRAQGGWANTPPPSLGKTTARIFWDNIFTFYNLVFVFLAGCLAAVGAWRDMLFLGVVVCNAGIGILQELRVRAVLQKAAVLTQAPVRVVRDGREQLLPPDQLVLDDVVRFAAGGQVCADAVVLTGLVEVNEALLTGEADPVKKQPGDPLLSGSVVVAGECAARLDRVGQQSYAARLTQNARRQKRRPAGLVRDLDRWLRAGGVLLAPFGVFMGLRQCALPGTSLRYAVSSTVAALCGMIPEGLYLLVSVALAVGVLRLARQRTLVHEMACIENLARVDTLCLDKTGTLTEGSLRAEALLAVGNAAPQDNAPGSAIMGNAAPENAAPGDLAAKSAAPDAAEARLAALLGGFARAAAAPNATIRALADAYSAPPLASTQQVPFSSQRGWSAQFVPDAPGVWYLLGAPERLAPGQNADLLKPWLAAGRRVLAFAAGQNAVCRDALTGRHTLLGYVVLADTLRPGVQDTLRYFQQQGVAVKVLSGDAPAAVGRIAQLAGVPNAQRQADMSALPPQGPADWAAFAQQHTVFGRVSPEQKRQLIAGLRRAGHTVAMLGDGVNDLPALKEADCSIAMAAGSEAARQASQIVLLDSNFAALPAILCEGRRVIQNVGRSASLFLVKNIFSFFTAAAMLLAGRPYPLVPIQITLISGLLIGAPSFLLTFEPCCTRPRGRFLPQAIGNALPGGLTAAAAMLLASFLGGRMGLPVAEVSSACTLLAGVNGLCVLALLCWPLTRLRAAVIGLMALGFFGATSFLPGFFGIQPFSPRGWGLVCALGAAVPAVQCALVWLVHLGRTYFTGKRASAR